jgi:hypothetical protein
MKGNMVEIPPDDVEQMPHRATTLLTGPEDLLPHSSCRLSCGTEVLRAQKFREQREVKG